MLRCAGRALASRRIGGRIIERTAGIQGEAAPLFILSFRHRDELAGAAERAGWRPIAARRAEAAERRFIASGATIAVVDGRGAFEEGLAAARQLADPAQANASALLVLLSRGDVSRIDAVLAAGATHYLASPFGEAEFGQTLRFATRYVERLAGADLGGWRGTEPDARSWRWRPGSDTVMLGQAFARSLGLDPADSALPLRVAFRRLGREGARAARAALERLEDSGEATAFAHDLGAGRIVHHLHRAADGAITGIVEDLGQPRTAAGPRRRRDALTGLDDRQGAKQWIDARLHAAASDAAGPPLALLLLAVTRFDTINAAFGRTVGDAILQGIARRIDRLAGEAHAEARLVARLAGAEFVVALAGLIDADEAMLLARRIAAAIERPFVSGEHVVTLACRIGLAAAEPGDREAGTLLRRASAALADAKAGERTVVTTSASPAAAAEATRLEIDLRNALDRDEIGLLFQPQVSIAGGHIVGVEALARWRHPELGELGAETLFAAAERSDYLAVLSAHVQRKALRLAAGWPDALGRLRMAVNITAADIARPAFAARFLAAVDASGFPRRRLTVEITESGLIEDLGAAGALLAELRAGGLRVAIDDFGTGYSSLAYLKALPLDYLKIDKRLSDDISGSVRDRIVVRGVIEMARSLGLAVIAEGVETEEQLALLAREGCNYYQGFLCAPPVDEAGLVALLGG